MDGMAVELKAAGQKDHASNPAAAGGDSLSVRLRKQFEGKFLLDLELEAPPGITIIFGPSGAGKSTLLDCIAGLAVPVSGRIAIGTRVLFDSSTGIDEAPARRKVGYVFQDLALFPHLSVGQNVAYGLVKHPQRRARVEQILRAFRIAHLVDRRPSEISGGERQRVALARALVIEPCVLLLDEPLSALDAATKTHIVHDLRTWNQSHRVPVLYVTHSREEVFALGERVVVLEDGGAVAVGTPHEVMSAPRRETVAQLAGFENIFDATVFAAHAERGTMTCGLNGTPVELETPLVRADAGDQLRIGIRAGDILLAAVLPHGLSARNILPGKVISVEQRDVIVAARVDCGVEMEVHLTLAARDSLQLQPGGQVWLVIKTHSCHLMKS
jgi:molybdate transport system ATP-binding protein